MQQKQYDIAVFIGRVNPLHNGHKAVIEHGLKIADKVLVLVGSSHGPRTIKNPFTSRERANMVLNEFKYQPVQVSFLVDYKYNDQQWLTQVQQRVDEHFAQWTDRGPKIALIGFDKDHTTDYLNWFPQWDLVNIQHEEDLKGLNATQIRSICFGRGIPLTFLAGVVPVSTMEFLVTNKTQTWWKDLEDEYVFIENYKKQWASSPYPPTFVTVDAVVIQDGHVLMVKRKASPGKGLLALPGGFINQNERIQDAVIRELREETRIKVPDPVLRGSCVGREVFDHPDRSLRGRTITHAFLFKLASTGKLPQVKGSDDAEKAMWVPLATLRSEDIFEDHFDIINSMVGKL